VKIERSIRGFDCEEDLGGFGLDSSVEVRVAFEILLAGKVTSGRSGNPGRLSVKTTLYVPASPPPARIGPGRGSNTTYWFWPWSAMGSDILTGMPGTPPNGVASQGLAPRGV